jgi:hypothetical protein
VQVECLLKALDNANRFNGINDTFAFLFIDGFSQQIYFVDQVCMYHCHCSFYSTPS